LWKQFGAVSLKDWLHTPEGTGTFEGWNVEDLIVMAGMWQVGDVVQLLTRATIGRH
jgi:hypothetical protein